MAISSSTLHFRQESSQDGFILGNRQGKNMFFKHEYNELDKPRTLPWLAVALTTLGYQHTPVLDMVVS